MKKKIETYEKALKKLNNPNNKIAVKDIVIEMEIKTNEINKMRGILHQSINEVKELTKNYASENKENSAKNYMEAKSVEDKFIFYMDRFIKYNEIKDKDFSNLKSSLFENV